MRTHYICPRIGGYFFKPKGVREQNSLRKTALSYETLLSRSFVDFFGSRFRICLGNNELADSTLSLNTPHASVFC